MFWNYRLQRAKDGDQHSAGLVLSSVADAVQQSDLPARYKSFLVPALRAIAKPDTPSARIVACKKHLIFAPKPGRSPRYKVKDRAQLLAQAVFDKVGDAEGSRLDKACEEVALEFGIGKPGNRAPDTRGIKLAYFQWLPTLREIDAESRRS